MLRVFAKPMVLVSLLVCIITGELYSFFYEVRTDSNLLALLACKHGNKNFKNRKLRRNRLRSWSEADHEEVGC